MYAVVDIETTGGSASRDRITEVAIFLYDGNEIVDSFVTLVNPERSIPYFITRLTGITDQMVAHAPRFCEVARKIVEITENSTFVAHNVNFDYNFIRQEFMRLGYDFRRDKLCTVQLSRKMIPGHRSYSLGNICKQVGIDIDHRHRAAGDAMATIRLLDYLLRLKQIGGPTGSDENLITPALEMIQKLPEATGVYYLLNEKSEAIYVGKSLNIRDRVRTHILQCNTRRAIDMKNATLDVGYEETGSELLALLLESHEIKRLKPLYNRLQRRVPAHYGLYSVLDDQAYINFFIDKTNREEIPYAVYPNKLAAREHLFHLVGKYELCQKLCGLYQTQGACFQYSIRQCKGACLAKEKSADYNRRVHQAINSLGNGNDSFFIIDKGRHYDERSVVKVEHGKYIGFGYFDPATVNGNYEVLSDCVRHFEDNRDVQQIIRLYIRQQKAEKLIRF
jgi:DNA polymerase-3 subunit epsilon